jgi:gliding motility-associated-like protein
MYMKSTFLIFFTALLISNLKAQSPTCNIPQLDAAMLQAGFVPLNVAGYPCAKYYYNPNQTSNWNTASNQAAAVGASLLTICDQAENDAVWQAAVAANVTGGLWIGYTDAATEGTWLWVDGNVCSFTNWNAGEPNNTTDVCSSSGEDVAIMQMANGRWNDVYANPGFPCITPAQYASLVKVNLCPQVTPSASALSVCEGDAVQLSGSTLFGSPAYTYSWQANNQNVGNGTNLTVNPNATTVYTVTSTDAYGCSATENITITTQNCAPQIADVCCPYVGWDFVQPITINNNAPVATSANLQTLLVLDTQTPISQNKMLANGNDIRFVYESCGNYLDYYIENGLNTPNTNIWVKMPSIPANGSITLYWYYGNTTAPVAAIPFTGGANSMFPNVLTIAGNQNLSGTQTADWIEVQAGATITMTNQQAVILNARKVNFLGTFNGNGNGYANQAGPGAGGTGNGSVGGGGGAYGGNGGGGGNANGGTANGTATGNDIDFGSGGGNSDCNGARGGGQLQINAHVANLNGTVNVEGATITNNCNEEAGGGGAGGGIRIISDHINGSGTLNTRGGRGQNSNDKEGGGGGSGGRIKLFHTISNSFSGTTNVQGGLSGTGGQSGMQPGQVGSVHQGALPGLSFVLAPEVPVSIPTASFSATTVCVNNPTSFTNQSSVQSGGSVADLSWDFGNGNTAGFSQNPTQTYASAGSYNVTLTVTSSTGCVDEITLPVTVNPGATASFTAQNVCIGNPTNFTNTSTGDIVGYVWSLGNGLNSTEENPTLTFPAAGNYSVTLVVSTANGCTAQSVQQVSVYALPNVDAGASQTICVGESAILEASGGTTYVWSPSATNGQPISPAATTTYTVTVTDANGCQETDVVNITVLPVPNAAISANAQVGSPNEIFTFTNNSTNGVSYEWDFGNGSQTTVATTAEQTTTYEQVGLYTVTLVVNNGFCHTSADLQIQIIVPELILFVPNVFTVNGDNINDGWSVQTQNATSVFVQIFNRWGNIIKELNNATDIWDGTIDGTNATDGVYFYKYLVTDNFNVSHEGHGFFHLISK